MNKKPHHHGNLREALITAGQELLQEGGLDALTLRQCAIRAGVSHAAPAHHFNGLGSLKMAIIARGYRLFSQAMTDAKGKAADDPNSQLLAICHGYLNFAKTQRALFELIFVPRTETPTMDPQTHDDFMFESQRSYQILSDACAPFVGAVVTETMIWALVHGYATLFGDKKVNKLGQEIPEFDNIFPRLELRK